MNCEDVKDLLIERVYGEGGSEARGPVSEHLASCEPCRREHARLGRVMDVLDAWEAPEVPHGLAERALMRIAPLRPRMVDRISDWLGLPKAAFRAGLSVVGGVLASILAVFLVVLLVSGRIARDPLPLNLLVVCGIYWAIAYGVLFWGGLFRPEYTVRGGRLRENLSDFSALCLSVLVALGVGGLLAYGNNLFGVEPVTRLVAAVPAKPGSFLLASGFFLIGGIFALISQFAGVFAVVRGLRGGSLTFVLAAGGVFTLVAAPALAVLWVPFTLGFFASALAGCFLGAITGGTLAFRLRRRVLHSAAG